MINSFNKLFDERETENNSTIMEFDFSLNETNDGLIVDGIKKSSTEEKVVIPSKAQFDGKVYPVTEIGEEAFLHSKLNSVVISDNIEFIGKSAFEFCKNLKNVVIGKTVSEIRDEAFSFCSNLTSIFLPENVKSIGSYAFSNTSLTTISIPDSVICIGEYAFAYCRKLTEVEVGFSLKMIPKRAFYGCEVLCKRNVDRIKSKVEIVHDTAFDGCSLIREIPNTVNNAFQANGIMPENVVEVAFNALYVNQYGRQCHFAKETSVLNEHFFSLIELETVDQLKEVSLILRYKKEELLETTSLSLTGKDDLIDSYFWLMNNLFKGKMKGKHELSTWYRKKKQDELADYVVSDTIDINGFKYPLRVSKVVVTYKDIEKTVCGFSDLYDVKGYEISKRGYRIPTLEEWVYFADSIEGRSILERQYKDMDAYEVCMVDSKHILHVNVKTRELAVLDYEYRRTHSGPLRDGFYRYVQSTIPEKDLFPEGYVNKEATWLFGEAETEYEEYLDRREPWDC